VPASIRAPSRAAEASPPLFTVVIPSLGRARALEGTLLALARQSFPAERFEIIVVLDGVEPGGGLAEAPGTRGVRFERLPERAGPGAARNHGATLARGMVLAFTEDDCLPDRDWLLRAAWRFEQEPEIEVLDGLTQRPGGRPLRVRPGEGPRYLPTNLFVRRGLFERVGGYHEGFFDPRGGIYFREDSDFGFTLEAAGARIVVAPEVRVTHPDEHPGFLDPLHWARRYEMDALLSARHPDRFRDRIEVVRLGPLRLRRPIVAACAAVVGCALAALLLATLGRAGAARLVLALAAALMLPIWAKWRFDPRRLPLVPLVPFVLVLSILRGRPRARRFGLSTRSRPGTPVPR
jgi:GT2 family glycosyltransferase